MLYPKVSVIVPCYGVEKYIDRCMESLVNQTLKDLEIILVDDGSLDRVPQMCDEWAAKDDRVKVLHKRNAGLGYARNSGLEMATGEYVAFVDSDDYIDIDAYRISYETAQKEEADAVFFGINIEYAPRKWKKLTVDEQMHWKGEGVKEYMLDIIACAPGVKPERLYEMSVWHSIFKRSILEDNDIKFLSERDVASEDLPFLMDFLQKSNSVTYIKNCFYYYCLNETSLTTTFKPEKYKRFRYLYELLQEKVGCDEKSIQRVDRFFIGYTRIHIMLLVASNRRDKLDQLKDILGDEIWSKLRVRYRPRWLPLFQSIFLRLVYGRNVFLIYLLALIVNRMKSNR